MIDATPFLRQVVAIAAELTGPIDPAPWLRLLSIDRDEFRSAIGNITAGAFDLDEEVAVEELPLELMSAMTVGFQIGVEWGRRHAPERATR